MLVLGLLLIATSRLAAETPPGSSYAGRPLAEVLQVLEARGLRILFSSDVVRAAMRVAKEPSATEPRAILDEILAPHGLKVLDGPGGTLLIVDGNRGAGTGDLDGTGRPRDDRRPADSAPVVVPERIVVTPDRDSGIDARIDSGRVVSGEEIRRTPAIGEDAQRAIAVQPGVAAGDRSAEISVRGGEPNEVLVLFDGLELYDPFHLKNFQRFSGIIDTKTVGSAEYFPGGFPVEYGDRMGGVLDLSSAVPSTPGRTFVSSSFMNSRFMTDGTFGGGAGHWLVSARGWYPDAVVRTTDREDEGFAPAYQDLLGKIQVPVGSRSVLTASFLAARDAVDFTDPDGNETVDATSRTRYSWVNLKSFWTPRLDSQTVFSVGRIQSGRHGAIDEDSEFLATVDDGRGIDVVGFLQDWSWRPSDRFLFKGGLGARWIEGHYEYASSTVELTEPAGGDPAAEPVARNITLEPAGQRFNAYVGGQVRPADPLQVEVGLRWDRQTHTKESQVSPRLSLAYRLGRSGRVRAAWGRYHQSQGIHELQVEDGVTDFFPAQRADQWSVGYDREWNVGLTLRAEAYVKEMTRLRPRFENLFNPFELLPEFEDDRVRIAPERASAKGVDLTLALDRGGRVAWWGTYSRSRVEDDVGGRMVPRRWDQPHLFQFGLHFRKDDCWDLTLTGVYHTGWPTTEVSAVVSEEPGGTTTIEPVPGPRNDARYPDYHRLDLRASRHFRLGTGRLTVFAEITNLYGRDNVCCVEDFVFSSQPDGIIRVDREDGFWLQRVPSIGFAWEFGR
jgi:outer membrane cobalamin receptor